MSLHVNLLSWEQLLLICINLCILSVFLIFEKGLLLRVINYLLRSTLVFQNLRNWRFSNHLGSSCSLGLKTWNLRLLQQFLQLLYLKSQILNDGMLFLNKLIFRLKIILLMINCDCKYLCLSLVLSYLSQILRELHHLLFLILWVTLAFRALRCLRLQ